MKRICLFAGYNYNNKIADYVVDYLQELSKYADIYYLSDGSLDEKQLGLIKPYVKNAWILNHKKYDFGSYSELAKNFVGWDEIEKYDELILANDSCFCLQTFAKVFEKMDSKKCDAWSLTITDELNIYNNYLVEDYLFRKELHSALFCLNSYFLVLRQRVIKDKDFQTFLNNVKKESSRKDVCIKYEMGLTRLLEDKKFVLSAFVDKIYNEVFVYSKIAFSLLKEGFPLLKVKIFTENPGGVKKLNSYISIVEKNFNPKIRKYLTHINKGIVYKKKYKRFLKFLEKNTFKRIPYRYEIKAMFSNFRISKKEKALHGFKPIEIKGYHKIQKSLIKNYKNSKNIVLYFSIARDLIGGGMLSINRFVEHSKDLSKEMNFDIILSGLPVGNAAIQHSMFKDSMPMIDFNYIVKNIHPENLLLNIPEAFLIDFLKQLNPKQKMWLKSIKGLRINILNQNIELMPAPCIIEKLYEYTPMVSISCAHKKYCTQKFANEYCCPLYLLPPFLPEFYRTDFAEKENIIVFSPDNDIPSSSSVTKEDIIQKLSDELPEFKLVEVNNLTLEEYKKLISKAKYSITFGEGYDGYFIEPYLSNSLSFAVYNREFFPEDFSKCPNIYESWESLYENIVSDIKKYNQDIELYNATQKTVEKYIEKYTSYEISKKYLKDFYDNKPTFVPQISEEVLFPIINELKVSGFVFYDNKVKTPDGLIFINNQGEFYSVLAEVYLKQDYGVKLQDSFVLIDLGLNVGVTSLYFSKNYTNCEKIYGFEPLKPTYQLALQNLEFNAAYKNKIQIKNVGLSDVYDTREVNYIPDWASGVSSEDNPFESEMTRLSIKKDEIRKETIQIVPASSEIKQIVDENKDKLIVIKCDIQGAEFEVIEDLYKNNLLDKIDVILLETHFRDSNIIDNYLKDAGFITFDTVDYIPNNIHMIYAVNTRKTL